jgi:hypothetical protein
VPSGTRRKVQASWRLSISSPAFRAARFSLGWMGDVVMALLLGGFKPVGS